jgi:hypothetical protein
MLGPGDSVRLTQDQLDDPHTQGLIDQGKLLVLKDESKPATSSPATKEG